MISNSKPKGMAEQMREWSRAVARTSPTAPKAPKAAPTTAPANVATPAQEPAQAAKSTKLTTFATHLIAVAIGLIVAGSVAAAAWSDKAKAAIGWM